VKRQKRLTKREIKALRGPRPTTATQGQDEQHIHCVACGRHLDPAQFDGLASATWLRCQHGGQFPSCIACKAQSQALLDQHDRTGQPVQPAAAWH
jgi:hypothetical protein